MRALFATFGLAPLLAACVPAVDDIVTAVPPQRQSAPGGSATPPPQSPAVTAAPPSLGFIPPTIMRGPGLEGVSGARAAQLLAMFGTPALDVPEGDARKLQFRGSNCVLDVYLYPLRPREEPVATWIEARRPDTGNDVDRAACIAALKR